MIMSEVTHLYIVKCIFIFNDCPSFRRWLLSIHLTCIDAERGVLLILLAMLDVRKASHSNAQMGFWICLYVNEITLCNKLLWDFHVCLLSKPCLMFHLDILLNCSESLTEIDFKTQNLSDSFCFNLLTLHIFKWKHCLEEWHTLTHAVRGPLAVFCPALAEPLRATRRSVRSISFRRSCWLSFLQALIPLLPAPRSSDTGHHKSPISTAAPYFPTHRPSPPSHSITAPPQLTLAISCKVWRRVKT